jgi:hypothetical protein
MLKYCQMPVDDGLDECGFLIGNICKANHDHEFRITADFLRCLKIVGCQSWQRYLDYDERKERFGNEAVRSEGRTATCEADRKVSEVQELPKHNELEGDRECHRRKNPIPVWILQTGCDLDNITKDHRHSGNDMKHIQCFVCSKNATANHKGFWLCADHLERTMNGMSLKEQKDKEEKK